MRDDVTLFFRAKVTHRGRLRRCISSSKSANELAWRKYAMLSMRYKTKSMCTPQYLNISFQNHGHTRTPCAVAIATPFFWKGFH